MTAKIAYFRPWAFPLANAKMEGVLRAAFSEYELDVWDVFTALRKNPIIMAVNLWHTLRLYGPEIAAKRKQFSVAFWRTPYIFQEIRRWAAKRHAETPYVFSFQIQSLFDASLSGRPRFVYTDHTHLANRSYPGFKPSQLFAPEWIELEKTIYRNATLSFVRSTNIARSEMEDYSCPPERVRCIYAGANISVPDPKAQTAAELERYQPKNILFVGIDWERKGGPDLLTAFRLVLADHPDAHLTIVGAKPDVGGLANCTVVGRIPPAEVAPYFQQASVFCMPTRLEPFGIVYVEALTYGLPIIATRIGAVPDMVNDGKNGFLVTSGDVPGLAHALNQVLESPARRAEFGAASLQLAHERYSWQSVGERLRENILPTLH